LSASRDSAQRLIELEGILAQSKTIVVDASNGGADPVAMHLAAVPAERIRRFAVALRQVGAEANDDIDNLTMRLLLNDYTLAVRHLRAVARAAAAHMDGAAVVVREGQGYLQREQKLDERRAARLAARPAAP
jgi:hypothetical protein